MHLMVMYDISDDKLRNKVADACLDYGLQRVQYSAFGGELGRVHQRELELRIRELVGRRAARIRFISLDTQTWERQRIIEHERGVAKAESSGDQGNRSVAVEQTAEAEGREV